MKEITSEGVKDHGPSMSKSSGTFTHAERSRIAMKTARIIEMAEKTLDPNKIKIKFSKRDIERLL